MQKNRVSEAHLGTSTGYGYNDIGRDTLEQVYADVFHTEAALVRPQITCGTHALTVALAGNVRPGDEIFSPVGLPYDTLQGVIGIREEKGCLKEYGITYNGVDLKKTEVLIMMQSVKELMKRPDLLQYKDRKDMLTDLHFLLKDRRTH